MKKILTNLLLAGTMALSSPGCKTIDRFVLGDGFECEAHNDDLKIILYKDGKRFARVEFNNPPFADVYTEDPTFDPLIAALYYEQCKEMLLEKYPPK